MKPITVEYWIDYEGYHHVEADDKTPKQYREIMKDLAKGECTLVVFPDPSEKLLGKVGFKLYREECAKLNAAKERRRKAAAIRKKKH